MSGLFERIAREKGDVFKDERALLPEFLPEVLPHREREVKEIALALQPASEARKPENIVLCGPPGTGKTSCARHVLNELKEYSKTAVPVYINCWEYSSRYAVLSKIAEAIGEVLPPTGKAHSEIISSISENLKKTKRIPIVCLDELDRLIASKDGEDVLYDLLRSRDVLNADVGVIAITNDEEYFLKLDARIKSSLGHKNLLFARYTPQQLKDILKERWKHAFFEEADENVVGVCAAHAGKQGGDARVAINALWRTGKEAEKEKAKKMEVKHAKQAVKEAFPSKKDKLEVKLEPLERKIIELLEEKKQLTTRELYDALKQNERTIRTHLARLEETGLIETTTIEKGNEGRTRIVKIKN
ncbi:AAA family ATPase [Candidatus Micrarchaeota archaeon]|nr:AAA family ATPase [Candidatus Micrarchaeota archaeon]